MASFRSLLSGLRRPLSLIFSLPAFPLMPRSCRSRRCRSRTGSRALGKTSEQPRQVMVDQRETCYERFTIPSLVPERGAPIFREVARFLRGGDTCGGASSHDRPNHRRIPPFRQAALCGLRRCASERRAAGAFPAVHCVAPAHDLRASCAPANFLTSAGHPAIPASNLLPRGQCRPMNLAVVWFQSQLQPPRKALNFPETLTPN